MAAVWSGNRILKKKEDDESKKNARLLLGNASCFVIMTVAMMRLAPKLL